MYEAGRGVAASLVQAYKWYELSIRGSTDEEERDKFIKYRDNIASYMTFDDIAEAKKLASEWKPAPVQ